MLFFVMQSPWHVAAALVGALVCFRLLTGRLLLSEFEPLGIVNILAALSFSGLVSLYAMEMVNGAETVRIAALYLAFYVGIFITSLTVSNKTLAFAQSGFAGPMFADDDRAWTIIFVSGLLLAGLSLFFSSLLLSNDLVGDYRTVLAKLYRSVDIIRQGSLTVFLYYATGFFLAKRRKAVLLLILVNAALGFFSGAKGFLLHYCVAYFTMSALIQGKKSIYEQARQAYLLLLVIACSVLVIMFWGGDTVQEAWLKVIDRIFGTGDLYYYSYVAGDYTRLYGEYHWLSYLLHPFTALVGVRGYEWPVGARLFTGSDEDILGFGPNPQLPILSMILLNGNFTEALLLCFIAGAAVCWLRIRALKLVANPNVSVLRRVAFFGVFFAGSPVVLLDVGAFEMNLISVSIVAAGLILVSELAEAGSQTRRAGSRAAGGLHPA